MISLQSLISKKDQSSVNIGLDIGSSSLKASCLSKKEGITKLEKLFFKPLDAQKPEKDLKEALSKLDSPSKKVNISLSGEGVILRYVNMPKMNESELKSAINFEASKYIPLPLEDVYLDASILKPDSGENNMFVLLAAVKKDILQNKMAMFKDTGYTVKLVDIDSLAAINAFNEFYYTVHKQDKENKDAKENIALVDVGFSSTTVSILEDGVPCFSRSTKIGGKEFSNRIKSSPGVSPQEADMLNDPSLKENNEQVNKVLSAVHNELLNEIQVSFDYYESHFNSSLHRIFLIGSNDNVKGLKDLFANSLGLPVVEPDISESILCEDKEREILKEHGSVFAVALGLGLRDD